MLSISGGRIWYSRCSRHLASSARFSAAIWASRSGEIFPKVRRRLATSSIGVGPVIALPFVPFGESSLRRAIAFAPIGSLDLQPIPLLAQLGRAENVHPPKFVAVRPGE